MRLTALLAAAVSLAGCDGERPPGPPVPLKSFVLHDIQGLHGGNAVWAADDRTAVVQVVTPSPNGVGGLWEKRYRITLAADQWAEGERLVGAHQLTSVRDPERPAVPDESHPIIAVVARDGTKHTAKKWGNDRHPGFDPVYSYLRNLCRPVIEPVHEGAFDWEWRPGGFDPLW